MSNDRPAIPLELNRQVLVEAGHRCAIPTCRQTPVEIAHIVPWSKVQEHTFDNLIALCPTCHARFDRGEIDRKAMQQYKANLSVVNSRYGDLERRVLQYFAERPDKEHILLFGGLDILLMNLLFDGYLIDAGELGGRHNAKYNGESFEIQFGKVYQITNSGREFINRWLAAQELD